MCSCMGSVSVSSCRCCMFVSCVHPVAVLNAALCMTCSMVMLVEDARGDHMRLLIYSAGSGVNRVQVLLYGFSMRLFCVVQTKTVCRYGCIYFLAALVLVCVDVMVMSSA